ncbi:MAG: hydrogenase maturation protease [Chloroflexota bacterium]
MNLIIGYGNPLRSDDRIGHYLTEILSQNCQSITVFQLTLDLAEPISNAERVIFIDARVGDHPGQIIQEYITPLKGDAALTHTATPESLLRAADTWYGKVPMTLLITVTGASFDYGENFSQEIRHSLPCITDHLSQRVKAFFEEDLPR